MLDLKDKVAIVTGASRGIGQAIATAFAQAGAAVVLTSRKMENVGPAVGRWPSPLTPASRPTPRWWSSVPWPSSEGWTSPSTTPAPIPTSAPS